MVTAPAPDARHEDDPADTPLSVVDGLVQLSFLIQNALARRATEHGLSLIQTRLLGVLRDRSPTMQELAKLLELDKSSVSGLIDRAERRGLVARVPSTVDRRVVLVTLSDAARAMVSTVAADFGRDVDVLLEGVSATDRDVLRLLVSRVLVADASARGVDLLAPSSARGARDDGSRDD